MIKTEELIERIGKVVGENDSDEYIELLEFIKENNDTEADKEDWKKKYEENDKEWRKRYRDRFFEKEEKEKIKDEDEDEDEDKERTYSYDELFEEEKK